ncbi:MAG: hypothetical protein Q8M76_08790, partial [Spirochaetaceae bacterium]|nr:hypothetical protein [Spirochaetaceae bacterium]
MILDMELRSRLVATKALIPAVEEELANPLWDSASARILIARLSPFRDVDRSSSHLVLFSELRAAMSETYIDFAFFPERRDRELLDDRGLPYFFGLASGRSAADFDLIMISNAFGLELVNLGYLHARCGIPLRASEREAAQSPILILGGSNAASAGCLLFPDLADGAKPPNEASSDALVDGIFFGEGEGAIGDLARSLTRKGAARLSRIEAASLVPGFWAVGSARAARRRIAQPMPPPLVRYPKLNSPEALTARLQITAGCPGFCSFCLEGWDRRPYREAPLASVLAAARELRAASGAETLEVYSFNFNTHSEL